MTMTAEMKTAIRKTLIRESFMTAGTEAVRMRPEYFQALTEGEVANLCIFGMPVVQDSGVREGVVMMVNVDGGSRVVPLTTALDELAEAVRGDD